MNKKLLWVLLGLSVLSFAGTLWLYPAMPYYVPSHWNANGAIDGMAPKWMNLVLGGLPLALGAGLGALPHIDPRKRNYKNHPKAYGAIILSVVLLTLVLSWVVNMAALGWPVPVGGIIRIVLGACFVVTGNFMPQLRSNFFAGFRTPWALENELVWRKTQKAGGIVLMVFGLLFILGAFVPGTVGIYVPLVALLPGVAGVYVYSWLLYKRVKNSG